jgi:hypothetical protein
MFQLTQKAGFTATEIRSNLKMLNVHSQLVTGCCIYKHQISLAEDCFDVVKF